MRAKSLLLSVALLLLVQSRVFPILDQNGNQQSDIWESIFGAIALSPSADTDGDGFTNLQEAMAGTNPLDPNSYPKLSITINGAAVSTTWASILGKRYQLFSNDSLDQANWQPGALIDGSGSSLAVIFPITQAQTFFHLQVQDVDSDSDGLTDSEEYSLGFNPKSAHTERYDQTDFQRVNASWNSMSTITVGVLDGEISERWPDNGVIAIRRSGGMKPVTVNFALGGTATLGTDYTASATSSISIPAGVREVWVEFTPIGDADDAESTETITLTVQNGAGYVLGSTTSGTVNLANETATSPPTGKAAARFLLQAAFGPDGVKASDVNGVAQNVAEVMQLGFAGWIDDQFTRPICKLEPFVNYATSNSILAGDNIKKQTAWWNRAMGVPKIRPDDANTVLPDFLRQRVAFALSQIFVVSDRPETLAVQPGGLANYYDMLLTNALGNFRTLLFDVSLHPCMGVYLSHLLNKPPANNIFPDENYAREVMQLLTIGLWQLNPDGTRQLDAQNQPIPTYNNSNITEFARVFTGLGYAGNNSYSLYPQNFLQPMKLWDAYHDCNPKTLLNGVTLPARAPSSNPDTGAAALADINAAVDCLFNHPNVGPFIGRQLIQRLVTSNPSPAYVGRIAATFANNGQGVRGDMQAVIKAILLDPEARDPAKMSDPTFGKLREPFLRCVNLAHSFNASAQSGYYALDSFYLDHVEEPQRSPSVFNFYLPNYSPPGMLNQAGLFAPEFQIINAGSAISGPNYFLNAIRNNDLHRWGSGVPAQTVRLDINQELAMIVPAAHINDDVPPGPAFDSDPLLRRLDLALTGGTLLPHQFQVIREAIERILPGSWQWHKERLSLAIYLIVTSPEFAVQR